MRRFYLVLFLALAAPAQAAPLHDAAKAGDLEAIKVALAGGAGVDVPDKLATPLFYAVQSGHLAAAELLIDRGADVNLSTKIGPPIAVAVLNHHSELAALLLRHGVDPNTVVGSQPILHIAVENNCLECARVLVGAGANINAQWVQPYGDVDMFPNIRTPLHLAVRNGFSDIANYLIEAGATVVRPASISERLATADVERGRAIFETDCRQCHLISKAGGSYPAGPNLWDVVGRAKASLLLFAYSPTLVAWGGVWTFEDLNIFLAGPTLTVPGVAMEVRGLPDDARRAEVIAYLRTLSDSPVSLP